MMIQQDSNSVHRPLTPHECVTTGSVVRLQIHGEFEEWEVTIVQTEEADPEADHISDECPIGVALIGRKVGDIVSVEVPSGTVEYRVLAVAPRAGQALGLMAAQ